MAFELDEVRRLTGPNLLSNEPGAIIDVFFEDVEAQVVIDCWQKHLHHCQVSLGGEYAWPSNCYDRHYEGGASMSISAPMDLLYSACDLIELAWDLCAAEFSVDDNREYSVSMLPRLAALKATIVEERDPKLLKFMQQAKAHDVVCLVDDDEISLGMGAKSETWPIDKFPDPQDVSWQRYSTIPLALITGTNGKSTSVRLAAGIAKAASLSAGVTSTDFIKVGDTIIDDGDYSGPGGARMVLRDKRTEIAFLEVARGGLLRRGLPVQFATVALITNVAADHLGQYGINTVEEIATVKSMVSKAIPQGNDFTKGMLVLNADDVLLVNESEKLYVPICWFSENEHNPQILRALSQHQPCVFVQNNEFVYSYSEQVILAAISDIPMTVNGTAKHNIQNALGVIGLTKALGISNDDVISGLMNFSSDASDNPGRGNIYEVNGVTVIVDFAHNSHSMQAVVNMASNMPAKSKHVMFSHAGDRSDKDMRDVANAVSELRPSTYVLAEIKKYLRGRALNETSFLVKEHLLATGIAEKDIILASDPLDGTKKIMDRVAVGDLVLLFVLDDREKVQALLTDK